jgi:hypothetical protein
MTRLFSLIAMAVAAAAMLGMGQQSERGSQGERAAVRFASYDLILKTDAPVAAWQAEIRAKGAGAAKVVGIEGGEPKAFSRAPFYDPAALHEDQLKERVILAAYSTAGTIPAGETRIARLHLQITGEAPDFEITKITLGDAGGTAVSGTLRLAPAGDQR